MLFFLLDKNIQTKFVKKANHQIVCVEHVRSEILIIRV